MRAFPYCRLVVIGVTSSGKSTLAMELSKRLRLDFVELDALYWEPKWRGADDKTFSARVKTAVSTESWVVAGNYSSVRPLIWPRAEALIWLDYPLPTVFWRLTRRTLRRWWTRELLWGTSREKLWDHFKLWSDDSLFHWLFKTYWRRKREIPQLLALPEHKHLTVFRFTNPKEADNWLNSFVQMPP
jgi:adenylate kinase family enzyme